MMVMTTIQRAALIALVGIVAAGIDSAFRPVVLSPQEPGRPTTPAGGSTTDSPASTTTGAGAEVAATGGATSGAVLGLNISVAEAHGLFQGGTPFLDARLKHEFEAGHVEGAFHLSTEHFMGGAPEALSFLDPASPVVVYCGGGACDASKNLVILLQQAGFTRCHIMHEGYPAWVAAGHPVATGGELGGPASGQSGGTP